MDSFYRLSFCILGFMDALSFTKFVKSKPSNIFPIPPILIQFRFSSMSNSDITLSVTSRQMGISLSDKKTLFSFAINKTGIECYSKYIIPIFNNIIPLTFDNGNLFIVPNDVIVMIFFNHWHI